MAFCSSIYSMGLALEVKCAGRGGGGEESNPGFGNQPIKVPAYAPGRQAILNMFNIA